MEACYEPFKKAVQSCGTELEETPTDSGGCLLWAVWSGRGSRWSFIQTNRSYLTIAGLHWHRALQMPWCVFKQEQTWRGARRVSALVTFSNQRCQTTQGGQVFCWTCYTQAGKNYSGMWWLMSVSAAETTNESFHVEGKWQKTDLQDSRLWVIQGRGAILTRKSPQKTSKICKNKLLNASQRSSQCAEWAGLAEAGVAEQGVLVWTPPQNQTKGQR